MLSRSVGKHHCSLLLLLLLLLQDDDAGAEEWISRQGHQGRQGPCCANECWCGSCIGRSAVFPACRHTATI
jgi:hypothetical protein